MPAHIPWWAWIWTTLFVLVLAVLADAFRPDELRVALILVLLMLPVLFSLQRTGRWVW